MFDAVAELSRQIAAHRAAQRQAAKDARNARRRARYATRPKTPKPAPVVTFEDDDWADGECRCASTPMPPCARCEMGDDDDA